jgi:hypothetical protein
LSDLASPRRRQNLTLTRQVLLPGGAFGRKQGGQRAAVRGWRRQTNSLARPDALRHTFNARDDRAEVGGRRVQPGPRGRRNQSSRLGHGAPVDALSLARHPGLQRAKHRAGSELGQRLAEVARAVRDAAPSRRNQDADAPLGNPVERLGRDARACALAGRARRRVSAREGEIGRACKRLEGRLRRRTMDAAGSGRRGEDASDSRPGRLAASLRRKTAPSRPAISSQAGDPATPRRPSRPDAVSGTGCVPLPTCPVGLRRPVFHQRSNTIIKWRHEIQRAEEIPWQIHQCTSDVDTF